MVLSRVFLLVVTASLCVGFMLDGEDSQGFEVRTFRDYYVQAEKIEWDYLPQGQNMASFYDE